MAYIMDKDTRGGGVDFNLTKMPEIVGMAYKMDRDEGSVGDDLCNLTAIWEVVGCGLYNGQRWWRL